MSTFGTLFRVTTFGESHCKGVGCIVDGCPPRLRLTEGDVQPQLTRRRPGQSRLTTPRDETDRVTILSGTERGLTLGSPIAMLVPNENVRPGDYAEMDAIPRPGHADYTYQVKYGVRAASGGGRSSARETIGRVAAGAIAEKWLFEEYGTVVVTFVSAVGGVVLPRAAERHASGRPWTRAEVDALGTLTILRDGAWRRSPPDAPKGAQAALDAADDAAFVARGGRFSDAAAPAYEGADGALYARDGAQLPPLPEDVLAPLRSDDVVALRCPHGPTAAAMATEIRAVKAAQDSIGGVLTTVVSRVPVGLGEPCFDKLEARLAAAMLSLPATKGFEIGSGFEGTRLRGSQHNDPFVPATAAAGGGGGNDGGSGGGAPEGTVLLRTATNNAGGTLGGISSGADIVFRVAIKSVSTISQPQATATYTGEAAVLEAKGRHDPCVLPRAPPLLEAMAALVIIDAALIQRSRGPVHVLSEEEGGGA
jgi:chorismate synthase